MSVVLSSQHLKQIEEKIIDKNDVLYFDYPLHQNVGDLLIYAGTEQFFKDYQINIRLRRCLQAFNLEEVRKFVHPNTTILFDHGAYLFERGVRVEYTVVVPSGYCSRCDNL